MPRLFTAIPLPQEINQYLMLLRGGLPDARWIEPEDFHITLSFIGDVGFDIAANIDDELSGISHAPFTICVGELSSFGGDRPRSVVAKVVPSQALLDLRAKSERAVRRGGGQTDRRKYAPHITIARLKNAFAPEVAHYISSRGFRPVTEFTATEMALFSARPSSGGGPYVIEADYPLTVRSPVLRPAASQ